MAKQITMCILAAIAGVAMACGPQQTDSEDASNESLQLRTAKQRVLASCPYTSPVISMDKELMIKDLSVVNDACRGKFSGTGLATCPSTAQGHWSFGYLASQLAGNKNAADTSAFVLNWLSTWQTSQMVNGFPLPARPGITNLIVNTWRAKSGCAVSGPCTLDFNQAPFRLLAIVNRIDLAGPSSFYTPNIASPGEMRFVFGFIDLLKMTDSVSGQGKLNAVVILEYKLAPSKTTFAWASQWHALSLKTLGTEPYNQALQAITDVMVSYNPLVNPGGTAIGQVRTNEAAFDTSPARLWELREQKLVCSAGTCNLFPDTVKLSPDNSFNQTTLFENFLRANAARILLEDFSTLPPSWIGGASRSKANNMGPLVWDVTGGGANPNYITNGGTLDPLVRHLMGLATCNGCHYAETATSNFHVAPRAANSPASISNFVGGSNALDPNPFDPSMPLNYLSLTDPSDMTSSREYNDAWRRKCELQRLLNGNPTPLFRASGAH